MNVCENVVVFFRGGVFDVSKSVVGGGCGGGVLAIAVFLR